MVRAPISAAVLSLCCIHMAVATEAVLNEYIKDFSGRWVCEATADHTVEGYFSKGETVNFVAVYTPTPDQAGLRYEWQAKKDGKLAITTHGLATWDPAKGCLRTVGFAQPGFLVESTITRDGGKWVEKSAITFPNAATSTATGTMAFADDGKEYTTTITDRVNHKGEKDPDGTRVWRKVSKNHEMLEKHLGWLIGTWTARVDTEQGAVDVEGTYKWIANEEVMTLHLRFGAVEVFSMILFDPSDGTIKMWGADSEGGNGQAVMRADGPELVWTNTVFDANGKKTVSDFTYIKKDDKMMYVKFVDEVDGQVKQILNTKK